MNRFFSAACLLASLAIAPISSRAQTTEPTVAYTGPRYPGGPDSLRALAYRSTRLVSPAPTGKTMLLFEIGNDGRPVNFKLVPPPGPVNPTLLKAAGEATEYIRERMLPWQLSAPDPKAKHTTELAKNALLLDFSNLPLGARPYSYAEQQPRFSALAKVLGSRQLQYVKPPLTDPAQRAAYISSVKGLVHYTQMQVRYPAEALRRQQEGQVYVSFEVAENGAIEHPEILGTAGSALDAEVLRVVQQLPAADAPALLDGRPVRVHYALPITFKIQ
ncbi:energy transducer TonB [Hymenobacter properus]|uniref:Energy transducer TonB n=1 Tax=Hymenobacter properus TaxID=2791026 RepID=A0A931FP23_9BACT|nr:energy transducer TonB [Hymenobacter properus]MBF9143204.1 energy transducer TonB [Hymenobacter properus]MBR7722013.1 energy transducer TonB [Microvirga sp. SRT04]